MTRGSRILVVPALVALLALAAGAADDPIKIGVVDVDQALNATEEGKAAREEFSRKQREADAEVQPLADRFLPGVRLTHRDSRLAEGPAEGGRSGLRGRCYYDGVGRLLRRLKATSLFDIRCSACSTFNAHLTTVPA